MKELDFAKIEKKWQKRWEEKKTFEVREEKKKEKFYVLEQYPYPSGSGLHMGHAFIYTIGDIYARFKRMQGYNVLYPIGFDSFGLPAENAAIKANAHPKKFTEDAIKNFIKHFKSFGNSYDWSKMIECHKPDYYKWDQWIFLKMYEKGLAYRKEAPVNWCSKCNTVLANEQVVNGKCWRHEDSHVEVRNLEQWFLRTTKYADEMYEKLNELDWPELIKTMQRNWIGKSHGSEVCFNVNGEKWSVFTTRPDTLFGVTFLVVSSQHPKLMSLVTKEQEKEVKNFLKKIISTKKEDMEKTEKEGVFTGSYAEHPLTGERIPIWTGNFVVAEYGSGMVMAVPAHDQRDFYFAKKYGLKIKEVVNTEEKGDKAKTGFGVLINSEGFNGLKSEEAKEHITNALEMKGLGKKVVNFRLRDWLISRQRFWGTPIPIIYCDKCGIVPVPEKELPVKLPENVKLTPGKNPLASHKSFVETKCPQCSGKARRETDTMDTFANSSWYFLRYLDSKNEKEIFDKKKVERWMPIDMYIGGKEHAVSHDIYFRFYTKFLRDLGLLKIDEPAKNLFNQGFVYGSDGRKMSKSYGNVVLPGEVAKKYGVDSVRMFLMSVASIDKDFNWSDEGVESMHKFLKRTFLKLSSLKDVKTSARDAHKLNKTLKEVGELMSEMKYNIAVIKIRGLCDGLEDISKKDALSVVAMVAPFAPHLAEELWEELGGKGFVSLADWPKIDEKKIDEKLEKEEELLDKIVSDVNNILKLVKGEKVYLYVLPNEVGLYNEKLISVRTGKKIKVLAVNDKDKYDPQGKAKKAKPGKPAIYLE